MATEIPTPADLHPVDQSTANDGAEPTETDAGIDWRDRFESQQKVNRDLEKKYVASDRKAKEAEQLRDELNALKAKSVGKEAEYAAEQKVREVESAALAKANERILKAEIRAVAANKLADPKDALKFLDLSAFEVGADGEVDSSAVTAAIESLVKDKPYLAAQGGTNGTVFESPGSHRKGAPASQLSQADLKGMTPVQINAARAEGRLNDLIGIKP